MGLVKKITDPMGFTTNYLYDKIGNVTSESFTGGDISTTKSYAYDYTGNTMTYTNENGNRIKYSYDPAGNLTTVADMENSNNTLEKYTYDVYMRPVTQTEGNAVTTLTYDNRDRVTSSVTKNTGGTKLAQTDYAYTTNATGPLTTTTVQGDSNAVTYTTSVQQDVLGRNVSETNRQGGVTSYTYDAAGNVTKVVPPDVNGDYNVSYTYDHAGNVLTETEKGDSIETVTKSYTYDMLGRMTSSTDGKGNKTTYTYTGTDWVSEIEIPFSGTSKGKTKYEYDKAGNVLKESVLSSVPGSSEKYRVTEYEYDALNRVTKSTVNGSSTTYEYDKVGNMTKSTTASGSVSYEYDQLNRVKKYTDALGKSETYTYSNAGDMTSKKDRNGLTTSYTYDALHRLTKESVTKDGKTNTNTYTYALTGQLVNESNGSTAKTYKYYKQGTAINDDESVTIDGISYRTKRVYDKNDNVMETFTYKGGAGEEMYSNVYVYDSKGRLCNYWGRAVTDISVNNAYNVFYTYDKNDNITNVSVSDNNKKNVKLTSAYSYNNANMLTSLVNKNGSGTTLSSYSYSYNLDGNINKKTETGKTTTYTYDGLNRLTGENITKSGKNTNMSYTYDGAGNRLSLTVSGSENYVTTYNYDANNRLIKSSKKNSGASYSDVMYYSYDNNGNQTRIDKAREANAGKMKLGIYSANENSGYGYEFFTYDGLNQLIKYGDEKNNTASYEYLSNGLRLSKTVKGEKTSFIWDGNNIQFTISSDETVSYSRAPGYMRGCSTKDMLDGVAAKNRESTLYLYNGHGDVTGTTNKDGNIKKTYDYDAFGNEISQDSSDTNPFRYCGEYYDSETESIYLRARYYNMSTGRFISEDPIKDGVNWYAYCGGNPVMGIDPSGLDWYIFYDPTLFGDGEKLAISHAKNINEMDEYKDTTVWRVAMSDEDDFIERWNKMGTHEGEGAIDGVVILAHGNRNGFMTIYDEVNEKYGDEINAGTFRSNNIDIKSMKYFIFLSCNAGKDDGDDLPPDRRGEENIAMGVSRSPQVINTVIASNVEINHFTYSILQPNIYLKGEDSSFKTYKWDSEYKNISINKIKENSFLGIKYKGYTGVKEILENM